MEEYNYRYKVFKCKSKNLKNKLIEMGCEEDYLGKYKDYYEEWITIWLFNKSERVIRVLIEWNENNPNYRDWSDIIE